MSIRGILACLFTHHPRIVFGVEDGVVVPRCTRCRRFTPAGYVGLGHAFQAYEGVDFGFDARAAAWVRAHPPFVMRTPYGTAVCRMPESAAGQAGREKT